ncbi:uncharacterized protein LOC144546470 [Carex rostrata]
MDPEPGNSSEVPSSTSDGNIHGFRGVKAKSQYSWEASVRSSNTGRIHLGTFPSAKMAAIAYDVGASALQGDRAELNFPILSARWTKPKTNSKEDIIEAANHAAKLYDNVIYPLEEESRQDPRSNQNYGSRPPHPNNQAQPVMAGFYHPYQRDQRAQTSGHGAARTSGRGVVRTSGQGQVLGGNPNAPGQYGQPVNQGESDQGIVQPAASVPTAQASGAPVVGGRLMTDTQAGVAQEVSTVSQEGSDTVQPAAGPTA